jgi:hypothetical protein
MFWEGVPMLAGMPLMNESGMLGSIWVSLMGTANGKGGFEPHDVAARAPRAKRAATKVHAIRHLDIGTGLSDDTHMVGPLGCQGPSRYQPEQTMKSKSRLRTKH